MRGRVSDIIENMMDKINFIKQRLMALDRNIKYIGADDVVVSYIKANMSDFVRGLSVTK